MSPTASARPRTANATETIKHQAAERAIDDPIKLARAARIIRLALARQRLTLDELTAPSTQDGSAAAA
jgi:hypothetical protein